MFASLFNAAHVVATVKDTCVWFTGVEHMIRRSPSPIASHRTFLGTPDIDENYLVSAVRVGDMVLLTVGDTEQAHRTLCGIVSEMEESNGEIRAIDPSAGRAGAYLDF